MSNFFSIFERWLDSNSTSKICLKTYFLTCSLFKLRGFLRHLHCNCVLRACQKEAPRKHHRPLRLHTGTLTHGWRHLRLVGGHGHQEFVTNTQSSLAPVALDDGPLGTFTIRAKWCIDAQLYIFSSKGYIRDKVEGILKGGVSAEKVKTMTRELLVVFSLVPGKTW